MGTTIRPELSGRNRYWIERHRYYELKHFCMQYPAWKEAYISLSEGFSKQPSTFVAVSKTNNISDPTGDRVQAKMYYAERIEFLQHIALETDFTLSHYILKGVTEGVSYNYLKMTENIPCCKDAYYDLYRRFFWLLDKARR